MRVLHVIPSLDPATGGPPIIAVSLAAVQAALGCQTQVVSYRFPDADERIATVLATIPHISQVKLEYLPPLTRRERFLARGARRRLEPMVRDADVVHLHGVWDPVIYAAGIVADRLGKPYVLTTNGMLDPWAVSQKWWKKRLALLLGYRRMLNRTAFLHYGNADERTLASRLHLTAPTRIFPNAIFPEELDLLPARGAFRAAHPKLGQAPLVLFLSRLHYKKGLDYLADAFAVVVRRFPDAQLVVAGPDGGARQAFQDQITRLGIADRVHLVGSLYGAEKRQALRDCDCFCLPSRQEGFSVAVTEAMACQAPVVISRECHFPEVAECGAGIVADLTAEKIAAGIATVLGDPQAAARMGLAGRALIVSRFTWPKVAGEMIQAYREIMDEKPGRSIRSGSTA